LTAARESATTVDQQNLVRLIETRYRQYQAELDGLRAEMRQAKTPDELKRLVESHPVRYVVEPSLDLRILNRERMKELERESRRASRQGNFAMLLLGLAGPISGIILGYGVTRGLSQSIYRLSVRVQDVAQRLEQDVAAVNLVADGDLSRLDRQLQMIIGRVEEVVARLQHQQREMLRTEQLSAVGQLAAGVAHEVRNPLAGIKLLVESALHSKNTRPLNLEDLAVIHQQVERLEHTVQGFLDFAKPSAPHCCRHDLREIITEAGNLIRSRAHQCGVQTVFAFPDQPVEVFVDRGQISTVLVNLFLNALDAMPNGGQLEVRLTIEPDGSPRVRISDTGSGISPEILPRLFTPFATTRPTGTGLGLSISRRIVEDHGGRIEAANRPEGGAAFTIRLPALPAEVANAQVVSG
jgi:signal transduction histidine kinase